MHHNKRTCVPLGIWGVQLALLNSSAEPPVGRLLSQPNPWVRCLETTLTAGGREVFRKGVL